MHFLQLLQRRSTSARFGWAMATLFALCCTEGTAAASLNEYHEQVKQAISALATLGQLDESETETLRIKGITQTLDGIRIIIPRTASVDWNGASILVDNSWLHQELEKYEKAKVDDQQELLNAMAERLGAIEEHLTEIEQKGEALKESKTDSSNRLAAILQRAEYAKPINDGSALARLWRRFWRWIENLLPKPERLAPGRASLFTKIAQLFVILLALAVIGYVARLFAPRLLHRNKKQKKPKVQPRIVLGETLAPDQSAADLLADAEALARKGEMRGAIRRAYIALLVELGERGIISLARHRTNRDYLSAVRFNTLGESEPLYRNVKELTEKFDHHWYGLVAATEEDWSAFRLGYQQALQ